MHLVIANVDYNGSDAVIFVVDANDPSRMEEAKKELYVVMESDELRNCALLVFANKQDLPNSLSTSEVAERLGLASKFRHVPWHCQGAVAVSGQGLYEGLDWLSATLKKAKNKTTYFS